VVSALYVSVMKTLFQIVLLGVLTIGFSLAEEETKPKFKHKLAADFEQCPDGHKALKDIPIVYGLVGPLHKKPEDYTDEDRKLRDRQEKGEIVFGGDITHEYSPKSQVVCKKCGFSYHPSNMPVEFPEMAYWSKDSKSITDFRIKFSSQLLSFPLLKTSEGAVNYSQTLTADGKRLDSETISYHTASPIDEVLIRMRQWLLDAKLDPKQLKRVENAYAHHTYDYNEDGVWVMISDDTYWEPGKISVFLMLTKKEANKAAHDNP